MKQILLLYCLIYLENLKFLKGGGCFPLIKCLVAKKKKTSVGAVNPIVKIAATGNCINGPYQYTFM